MADNNDLDLYVTKRNGKTELLSGKKILQRTKKLGDKFGLQINYSSIVLKVMDQLYNHIKTNEIDELMCQMCASMGSSDYDYYRLSSLLCVSNHQKETSEDFVQNYTTIYNGDSGYLSQEFIENITTHQEYYKSILNYDRDYEIDYFGYKTLERAYLMRHDKVILERIQHMWLRVAIQIHGNNLDKVKETYENLSQKNFIHATPTLFNSGTKRPQLSSCYLIGMEDDSIDGIFNTLHDCASISKWAGGIGLHIHNVRASGTHIVGTNGTSNGLVPMLRVFNNTARYVDQCVLPETLIYTTNGVKEIQNIVSGIDQVYNEKGNVETVQNVLEHTYSGKVLRISTYHSKVPLVITTEHPVLAIQERDIEHIQDRLERNLVKYDYIDAKSIDTDTYIAYRAPSIYKDYVEITEAWCKVYGVLLDSIVEEGTTSRTYTFDIKDKDDHDLVKSTFDKFFIQHFEEGTKIKMMKSVNFPFHNSDFFDATRKPSFSVKMMNLPVHKAKIVLDSMNNIENFQVCKFFLCLSTHSLKNNDDGFWFKEFYFSRVQNVEESTYDGVLYDLQMKEEHNYMLQQGIVHNGGGKRSGSFAMYLEPWHSDIQDFLELRKNHGDEESRARDLFYALWIPDLFMKKVENDDYWYLMCPHQCPGLSDAYGEEFEELYNRYVTEEKYNKKIKARELWFEILDSQMETGTPYMLYKDASNKKSNQNNLGTIKSSNLCTEVIEYSDDKETAVCNLASISLSAMVDETTKTFDYDKLQNVTEIVTENLNNIIDKNFYPTIKTYRSNMNHRPIGIGVQGLADAFSKMDLPFDSDEAQSVNKDIFETIYYGSMKKSNELAQTRCEEMKLLSTEFVYDLFRDVPGYLEWFIPLFDKVFYDEELTYYNHIKIGDDITRNITEKYHKMKPTMKELLGYELYNTLDSFFKSQYALHKHKYDMYDNLDKSWEKLARKPLLFGAYSSFEGSPLSKGQFQFDLWNVAQSDRYDWDFLRENIKLYGTRNSLCVAPMPTASTSQILSNNECFEPFTSNIYSRRTLAGEFVVINKYLLQEMKKLGLWSVNMKNKVIEQKGSIQNIDGIPDSIKSKYKIVWDMSMKRLIDMAKERGAYICQSQSMNLWVEDPNYNNLTKMHFYAWRSGLKTGIYYLRRKAKHQAQQFTIEPTKNMSSENIASQNDEHEVCEMCSG